MSEEIGFILEYCGFEVMREILLETFSKTFSLKFNGEKRLKDVGSGAFYKKEVFQDIKVDEII